MNNEKDFLAKEPLGKLLMRLALPTVAAQLINMLYNIVDRMYCLLYTSIPYGTILEFVQRTTSTLSVMKNGEHWFHTEEQMKFLDEWIIKSAK